MKKVIYLIVLVVLVLGSTTNVKSQEVTTGVDLYSSYVWRGTKFGNGPAVQPWVDMTAGGFSLGAWGSVCVSDTEAYEMDLYAKYAFGFGLSLGVNDYYFGGDYFTSAAHTFEPFISFETGNLSLTGAYMLSGDAYGEIGYTFGSVSLSIGAGNGAYTTKTDGTGGGFGVCNVGIGTSKEIKITEDFSLPVSGSVIVNPATQGFFIVVGISL